MEVSGGFPPGAWRASSGRTDDGEEGLSSRKSRTKVRERSREGGLKQGQEENQAAGAPCVTVHLRMVVERGELWRCSGAGAC